MSLRAALAFVFVLGGVLLDQRAAPAPASIVRLDPRFDRLVPPDAAVETIASGFTWVEGPAWHPRDGHLVFSDIPANAVHRWREGRGVDLLLKPSGYSGRHPFAGREPGANGLAFDAEGRLLLCEHGDRRISRLEGDGRRTTLADRYQGKRLNSPNDLLVAANGDVYFTDPPFGLPGTFDDPGKELAFSGVYRLTPNGQLTLLTDALRAPNGLALSPDARTLYVSNADRSHAVWMAFAIQADGTLGPGRVLRDETARIATRPGAPDGMKVDADGHLFAAGPGGVYVMTPDGALLGMIDLGVATSNVAFGGRDRSALFITAGTSVYRVRLSP